MGTVVTGGNTFSKAPEFEALFTPPSYGECSLAKVLMQKETPKPVATCLNESFITFLFT